MSLQQISFTDISASANIGPTQLSTGAPYWNSTSVGIGTSNPSFQLHQYLSSGTTYRGNQNGLVTLVEYASTTVNAAAYGTSSNHPLLFQTNNYERMRIDTSGNLGIGTSSPGYQIDSYNSSTNILAVRSGTQPVVRLVDPYSNISDYTINSNTAILRTTTNFPLAFAVNGGEVARFNTSGYLGINTSSPGAQLDVIDSVASGTFSNAFRISKNDSSTGAYYTGARIALINTNATVNNFMSIGFEAAGQNDIAAIWASASTHTSGSAVGYLAFGTNNGGGAASERMRITSAGNVGIGTSSPNTQLQVAGSINSLNTFGFKNRIINGSLAIWQRGTSGSLSSSSAYFGPDRFQAGGQTWSFAQSTDVPSNNASRYSLEITSAAGSYGTFVHKIESYNCQDMVGQVCTFSLWIKRVSGSSSTLYLNLQYPTAQDNWSSSTSITVNSQTITSSWAQYSVTFTAPAGVANGLGFSIYTDASSAMDIRYAQFQMEIGSAPTSFDVRSIGIEQQLCQRYYETFTASNGSPVYAYSNNTNALAANWPFMVPKRTAPTVTQLAACSRLTTPGITDYNGVWNFSIYGSAQTTNAMFVLNYVSGSAPAAGLMCAASLGLSLSASAEL